MKLPLKARWKAKVPAIKPRMYPLGNEAHQLLDEIFDKIYCLGHLKFSTIYIPFSFSVFVVWKTDTEGKRKGRTVLDI